MSLLPKALEINCTRREELKGVIPLEGGMHMLMSIMTGIAFLFGDAGLRQLFCLNEIFIRIPYFVFFEPLKIF
jgi:hypothetical protein